MATCLARAGLAPLVWSRNAEKSAPVVDAGAVWAEDAAAVLREADVICVMLADEASFDMVFARDTPAFSDGVRDRVVVHMGTMAPSFSEGLAQDIAAAGGRYVEMPVSGSSKPAAEGALIAMASGDPADIERVTPLMGPMVAKIIPCGAVPKALQMKVAVNTYLIGLMLGLLEGFDLARACDLNLETFAGVLEAGPMSNDLMRMKLPKLLARDYAAQGSMGQFLNNLRIISEAGADVGAALPGIQVMHDLAREAAAAALLDKDFSAVIEMMEARRHG